MTDSDSDSDLDINPLDKLPMTATKEGTRSVLQALDEIQAIRPWRPEEGEALAGVLLGIKPASGPFGPGFMLLIRDDDGQKHSMWLTAYLKGQLEGFNARPGDMVGIKFLGKATGARGNPYNQYTVIVQRQRRA